MIYSATSFTVNGEPIDAINIDYRSRDPNYGIDMSMFRQASCVASIDCTIPLGSIENFGLLFHRQPAGASYATLARRVKYGGRKGRSAMRRLLHKALPINVRTKHAWFRGRAVMLNETEMLIKASEQR